MPKIESRSKNMQHNFRSKNMLRNFITYISIAPCTIIEWCIFIFMYIWNENNLRYSILLHCRTEQNFDLYMVQNYLYTLIWNTVSINTLYLQCNYVARFVVDLSTVCLRPSWLNCSASELQTVFNSRQGTQNKNLHTSLFNAKF